MLLWTIYTPLNAPLSSSLERVFRNPAKLGTAPAVPHAYIPSSVTRLAGRGILQTSVDLIIQALRSVHKDFRNCQENDSHYANRNNPGIIKQIGQVREADDDINYSSQPNLPLQVCNSETVVEPMQELSHTGLPFHFLVSQKCYTAAQVISYLPGPRSELARIRGSITSPCQCHGIYE